MADVRKLERTLIETLHWNKARINFLTKFLVSLIIVRSVNLSEIANSFSGKAKVASHYKRIQRFLHSFELDYQRIAIFVARLLNQSKPWILTMDRTNWKLGKANLNILVLGIAYKGIAFPLFWKLLDKRGNSSTAERTDLMEDFIECFGTNSILYLCADREFIGERWLQYLRGNKIDFRIRIRNNIIVPNAHGATFHAKQLFANLPIQQLLVIEQVRKISGLNLYLAGMRLEKGDYLIVISLCYSINSIADYANRWQIETLFSCLKSRGFRLEDTHLTDPARLQRLIALLAIAFCWAHIVGEWLVQFNPIKIKKHGRKSISIFRLGFDRLRKSFTNFDLVDFAILCQFLSCT